MFKRLLTKKNVTLAVFIVLTVLFFYFILPISIPIVSALILALVLEPAVRKLEFKFGSRKWSVTALYSRYSAHFISAALHDTDESD